MKNITVESEVEEMCLEFFRELGYSYKFGEELAEERTDFRDVVFEERLRSALERNTLNKGLPIEVINEAIKKIKRLSRIELIQNNELFHKYLSDGIQVEIKTKDGIRGKTVYLIDFEEPKNNEFLAVNQFTIKEKSERRPDILIFLNGLPIAIIELKNPTDENATISKAFEQIRTYTQEIPSIFNYNELCVISDGTFAQVGTFTSPREWFLPWKSLDGEIENNKALQLETLIKGIFKKENLIDILRNFIIFINEGKISKKVLAGYHQFFATNKALKRAESGDSKIGVVWHTQGSGKSYTMAFLAGKLMLSKKLKNPTIVVLTDRNDLDGQLFDTFASCKSILREAPKQATSTKNLKEILNRSSGGIIFATMQKFAPEENELSFETISKRTNIIVMADEAHRTQYGFKGKVNLNTGQLKYGYAKYLRDALPNASFIGFTGTPIELVDKDTKQIFGNYVDIYDISQAELDNRTVKIYYESRIAKIKLKEEMRPKIDSELEEITENEEETRKEKLKSKWATLEAMVGSKERVQLIAKDIVEHFEKRQEVVQGKAMIVGMSRRICIDLYDELIKLRPNWENKDDDKGILKVIMTGAASDKKEWQKHIRDKKRRKDIGNIFKKADSEIKLVIVRDMWLTGFDVPSLNTLYVDKPMKGHGLMQAIARVNRVFKDKSGGLIVDYLGLAADLKFALSLYTDTGRKGKPFEDKEEAVAIMQTKYEIVKDLLHNFDYTKILSAKPKDKLLLIQDAMEFILSQKDGKKRFIRATTELATAFALCVPDKRAEDIRDDVAVFVAIKAIMTKSFEQSGKSEETLDSAIKQIVSKAISSDEVVDIFQVTGLKKPDVSILSEKFLAEIQGMKHKNLAFEALKKLLNDEIRVRFNHNKVMSKKFSEMLELAVKRYQNRAITTVEVLSELIKVAKEIKEEQEKGIELDLNEDEKAFYDALIQNESAVRELGDDTLRKIAVELTEMVKDNTTVDWELRESVRAGLRRMVKKLLRKYNYPPDRSKATELVLLQAKAISDKVIG
ncbi:MAG: type I restriction endonuclease subunit R [Sphaerochaetaceae bacterium]|nr:type I restriction endonuclease subunit R [Sphaerochaetaceae bacterium]